MPPLRIRVAAGFDLQCGAAHPGCLPFMYQAKNAFDRFGFVANTGLTLIVRQTVQATGIQIKSQSQCFSQDKATGGKTRIGRSAAPAPQ